MSNTGVGATGPVFNITPSSGPLVSVSHTKREMKIFGVTENELRTLSIVNAAMTALFALGTGCFGYLLNLNTSIALAQTGTIPRETEALVAIVQPGLFSIGTAFYVLGFISWIMKSGFIGTIKRESDPSLRQAAAAARAGKLRRMWHELRS